MEREEILGSQINMTNIEEAVGCVEDLIKAGSASYICISNVHTVVMGRRDHEYAEITCRAHMALPDGMPLVWIGRLRKNKSVSRCAGADLMTAVFRISEEKGFRHFFYGGTDEMLEKLESSIKSKYPKLIIAGKFSPPFGPMNRDEEERAAEMVRQASPHIVWVGLGAPKQEIWMANNVNRIAPSVMIGVGAALGFHAGTLKRAPVVLQRLGLEWFYRIIQEPRRLWKRYLTTNILFVYYIIADRIKRLSVF